MTYCIICENLLWLVIPKLGSISDVVIAEGDPINIAVNVIEGKPSPDVTCSNATRDQLPMLVALNSTHYQIRKISTSISDGGVYRVEAMKAIGRDSINFTVTVHCKLHGIQRTRETCFGQFLDCVTAICAMQAMEA